jgi:dienelactone hydrolase
MSIDQWPEAPELQRADIALKFGNNEFVGHLVAPPLSAGPRPLVLVIHNYQGLKFFDVDVAEYLARLGYVGLAVDMYGSIVPAAERTWPDNANQIADYQKQCFEGMVSCDHDHAYFRDLIEAWRKAGLGHPSADSSVSPSAIGYCFGGVAVLEAVRGGLDFAGVVSLHGLLQTGEDPSPGNFGVKRPPLKPCENNHNTKTVVMIENGADDHLVLPEHKQRFYEEMNNAGVQWIFNDHAGTPHGFALPPTIGPPGHLHEATDRRSTMTMLNLFRELYPNVKQNAVAVNGAGTPIPA